MFYNFITGPGPVLNMKDAIIQFLNKQCEGRSLSTQDKIIYKGLNNMDDAVVKNLLKNRAKTIGCHVNLPCNVMLITYI